MSNVFPKIILKSGYHQICMPKKENGKLPIEGLYEYFVRCIQHSNPPSMLLLMNRKNKLYINSNKYYFMTSHAGFICYVINTYGIIVN